MQLAVIKNLFINLHKSLIWQLQVYIQYTDLSLKQFVKRIIMQQILKDRLHIKFFSENCIDIEGQITNVISSELSWCDTL